MMQESSQLDFLAAGEAMVDLISQELVDSLDSAAAFYPYPGGQPSNLAAALARLGKTSAIAACIGEDGFGRQYLSWMQDAGVVQDYIQTVRHAPTTIAAVSRNQTTPEFIIFRGADFYLEMTESLRSAAARTRIFHTSAFALARRPARDTILALLQEARAAGAAITFDPNFHPSVWPDIEDFQELVFRTLEHADFTKPSMEDGRRLFGEDIGPEECALRFLQTGVRHVVLTMGTGGTLLASDGRVRMHIPTHPPAIVDVTGAGDSFWAGMLSAYLDGKPLEKAVCYGQAVAETKLGYTGPLRPISDADAVAERAEVLYEQLKSRTGIL